MAKLQGAKIGDYHTLTDWGLYLKVGSPKISDAEVDEYLVKVPGSDTLLNLTDALDGRPHYKKRTITMELLCRAPKKDLAESLQSDRKRHPWQMATVQIRR